jgi:hypothetical protein
LERFCRRRLYQMLSRMLRITPYKGARDLDSEEFPF